VLDNLVLELLEKETLDKEQIAEIFSPVQKRPARPAWTGSARRLPSDREPVAGWRGPVNGAANGSRSNGHPAEPVAPSTGEAPVTEGEPGA